MNKSNHLRVFIDLPLNNRLILPSCREKVLPIVHKLDIHNMLTVSSEASSGMFFNYRISVDVHKSKVISSGKNSAILCKSNTINVRAITARREYSLYTPPQFARVSCPNSISCVGSSTWVLLLCIYIEEEKLVSTTVASDVRRV